MSTTYPIYAAGRFLTTTQPLTVYNAYDNSIVAETYQADTAILEEAIQGAQAVAPLLAKLPSHKRYAILMDIASKLEEAQESMAQLIAQEATKPIMYARGEVQRAIQTFRVAAEESKRIPTEMMSLDWTPAGEHKQGYVQHVPAGIVAGISPFNFPLNLAVHKIAPAIAAGCPIILKPASATPLATLLLAQLIDGTELPKGAVSILPMDRTSGNQLVTDDRFAVLSFTGSPEVGWMMKDNAKKKKVVLELGGNAGVIVTESADLERAVTQTVSGAFAYAGQVCVHTQRIYVQRSVFEEFTKEFITRVEQLRAGNPLDEHTQISSMIDEKNAIRIESWIQEALEKGATILTGGERSGSYIAPTVLTNVPLDATVCIEEAFGPVVILEAYDTFAEALALINDSKFGLQAGVFTNNIQEQYDAWNTLHVGGVIINDVSTFRVDHMPYGGIKDSGLGREGVKYAMLDMLEPRIMVVHHQK